MALYKQTSFPNNTYIYPHQTSHISPINNNTNSASLSTQSARYTTSTQPSSKPLILAKESSPENFVSTELLYEEVLQQVIEGFQPSFRQKKVIGPTSEAVYNSVKEATDKQNENIHFYYDHQAGSIILQCVPSTVHQSTHHFLNMDLPSALQSWADDLSIDATVRNYGDEGHDLYDSDGIQAKGKAGDASIRSTSMMRKSLYIWGFHVRLGIAKTMALS